MYVDLSLKENEVTLEKTGWSLCMYVRAWVGHCVCMLLKIDNIHVC